MTVTAPEIERITFNPLYSWAEDPVRDWAQLRLHNLFAKDDGILYGFEEMPQEIGKKLQVMQDLIRGRTTIEQLKEEANQSHD